jgi:hypothetical protein
MTKGETLGLLALGIGAVYVLSKAAAPRPVAPLTLPSGGSQTAVIVGGVASIIDSLTGALAGSSSNSTVNTPSDGFMGF